MRFEPIFVGLGLAVFGATAGCATHQAGFIHQMDDQVALTDLAGNATRLTLSDDGMGLDLLDGPSVEVWGKKSFSGAIRVDRFKIQEGNHGLPVWFGELQTLGAHLGLDDQNSGAFYAVGESTWPTLKPLIGQTVMLEGFVDGPHRVKVLHYLVLRGANKGEKGSFDIRN